MLDKKWGILLVIFLCFMCFICSTSAKLIGIGKDSNALYEVPLLLLINIFMLGTTLIFSGILGGIVGIYVVLGIFPRTKPSPFYQNIIGFVFVVLVVLIFLLTSYLILDPDFFELLT